jgi:hypothetical protein
MSTEYRVCGRGVRLSERKISAIAKQAGGSIEKDQNDGHLVVCLDNGCVHHYNSGKASWNWFTRYGGNWRAVDQWIEYLNACGYSVLSEHDEGFLL